VRGVPLADPECVGSRAATVLTASDVQEFSGIG